MPGSIRTRPLAQGNRRPRYLVRQGNTGRGWMVWDRQTKGPAKYLSYAVVELPEDKAREIADVLTKRYIAEG